MTERRFLAPEVVQTSEMDCGPASLKCILEGFGIPVSYGRLREACQTDVDGTSIDTMEEVAIQLGLEAEQTILPEDHLLLPESDALPAIVVTRNPTGLTHFVVVWRVHGPLIQVMDPGMGRRWLTKSQFLRELYIHSLPFPSETWREWAESEGFSDPLRQRLNRLGLNEMAATQWLETALADPSWRGIATLDAVTRMVTSLVVAGGIKTGPEATALLERFFLHATTEGTDPTQFVPVVYWSVQPIQAELQESDDRESPEELLILKGAVLVRMVGHVDSEHSLEEDLPAPLSTEMMTALQEPQKRPEVELWRFLGADGLLIPTFLIMAMALVTASGMVQTSLFRGIIDLGQSLSSTQQRIVVTIGVFSFTILLLLIQLPLKATMLRMGRRFEIRLRVAFLEKIPHLNDQFFQSRLISDMIQRAHDLRQLRNLPGLGLGFVNLCFQVIMTAAAVVLIDPQSLLIALVATIALVGFSLLSQPILIEQDSRLRTHIGALTRFYLDALLGLVAVRTHGAERTIRRAYEGLLVEWSRTSLDVARTHIVMEGLQAIIGSGFAIWLLFSYLQRGGHSAGVILILYWGLNLPKLGQQLADQIQQYPLHRNRFQRFLEPLGAPEDPLSSDVSNEQGDGTKQNVQSADAGKGKGISIVFDQVSVQLAGHAVLTEIDLTLEAGSAVAIVGPSGAGKSSLAGLLLGWYQPVHGQVLVDGEPLTTARLQALRQETAWIDPAIHLWNRSLFDNLTYGTTHASGAVLSQAIDRADLFGVLERMPNGLQTVLGEGGGLVSGGEGQRVRFGRAVLRPDARLIIMDEPFRGLDREKRRILLTQARQMWPEATFICITHDVSQTLAFERVLVIDEGRIAEDAAPTELIQQPNSRYAILLQAEEEVHQGLWSRDDIWRRLYLENGVLSERTQ